MNWLFVSTFTASINNCCDYCQQACNRGIRLGKETKGMSREIAAY